MKLKPEFAKSEYQAGQHFRPEGQEHYEPRCEEEGTREITAPLVLAWEVITMDEDFTSASPTTAISVVMETMAALEYSSHRAGYGGHGAPDGHEYCGEHRQEYPEGGHNALVTMRAIVSTGVDIMVQLITAETTASAAARTTTVDMWATEEVTASMEWLIEAATLVNN